MTTTTNLDVVLKMEDGTELQMIPGMTPEQSLDHYSLTYPKLATATIKAPFQVHDKLIYEVKETLGTKG